MYGIISRNNNKLVHVCIDSRFTQLRPLTLPKGIILHYEESSLRTIKPMYQMCYILSPLIILTTFDPVYYLKSRLPEIRIAKLKVKMKIFKIF